MLEEERVISHGEKWRRELEDEQSRWGEQTREECVVLDGEIAFGKSPEDLLP